MSHIHAYGISADVLRVYADSSSQVETMPAKTRWFINEPGLNKSRIKYHQTV
jgi:hypothetical protein